MLSNHTYPAQEPVLEEVYSKILPNRGHKITLVMHSLKKSTKNKNKMVYWNGAPVYLTMDLLPRKSRFERLINNIFCGLDEMRIVYRLVKSKKFDIVQARNGVMVGLLGVYLKKKYGIKFSFRYTDPVPEADIYASKSGTGRYPLIYLFRGIISKPILMWIMHKADLILPVSKWMKQYLIEKGISEEKMMVFPMGADFSVSPNKPKSNINEKFKLNNSPTVIYVGTMIKLRNLTFLLLVFAKVKKKVPDAKLLMVGDGDDRPQLEKLSKTLNLQDNVIFTGRVPHSQVAEFIAVADVGAAPIIEDYISKFGVCTKAMEYMVMGKPFVVCRGNPDIEEIIEETGCGICTRRNEDEFAEAMNELLINPKKAKEMGKAGRRFIEENRSYGILACNIEQKYLEILQWKDISPKI